MRVRLRGYYPRTVYITVIFKYVNRGNRGGLLSFLRTIYETKILLKWSWHPLEAPHNRALIGLMGLVNLILVNSARKNAPVFMSSL